MRILLVAEESAGIQTLRAIDRSKHELVAVMAREGGPRAQVATVANVAGGQGVEVWPPELVKDPALATRLHDEGVDLLLNVHSLYIVDAEVLRAPTIGSFNLHPGPLPEIAGLNAPSWAIYLGESRHGVALHWMDPGLDAGPIAYQARFDIGSSDTGLSVSARCVREGMPLVARLLEAAEGGAGSIPRIAQDLSRRRYFGAEAPHGGRLPWRLEAGRIAALVRAADYGPFRSPWGHPVTELDGSSLGVVKASATGVRSTDPPGTVGAVEGRAVRVAAGDEWVLLERVQMAGSYLDPAAVLGPGARLDVGPEPDI